MKSGLYTTTPINVKFKLKVYTTHMYVFLKRTNKGVLDKQTITRALCIIHAMLFEKKKMK